MAIKGQVYTQASLSALALVLEFEVEDDRLYLTYYGIVLCTQLVFYDFFYFCNVLIHPCTNFITFKYDKVSIIQFREDFPFKTRKTGLFIPKNEIKPFVQSTWIELNNFQK